ncbi:Ankyrin 2,3/unc44, putative [Penicillium digitatum PHI26]|uniref:Ankyrin 2,3/unc44, putative n=2 Tax=Penicillium digitatum TaxID=36651 RepID=K9FIJ0_PEND2|nr:Ankyrin 2,3/unc44, putative [Penicillium digitatum Pd1]EKV07769.1 Ankyrin 2,3/unc44, putative [Penicillium digitatum Pd1]EKV09330.1 Ankyrin 2,3/unc44, putative [Penicillium digitatum PHI26]
MTLHILPNELLLAIAETQNSQKDINAFARTSRRCYILLNPFLYAYNVQQHQGSALHWAAIQGQLRTAKESLRQGAEIESRHRKTRKTPLIHSAQCGHADVVALLLAHGANPHAKGGRGTKDPITSAVLRNRAAVASILLDNGVDVNLTGYKGSLLHLAAEKCHNSRAAVARVLIERGANLESMNDLKQTPLQVACESDSVEVARCLIESGADLDVRCRRGRSLLHLASSTGSKAIELLVEKGVNLEVKDENGETPLHLACWFGRVKTAAVLLDQGADIEARSSNGSTPLLRGLLWELSVRRDLGLASVTALLLERGANPGQGNNSNITPLHCVTSKIDARLFKRFIEYGADPEPKTRLGVTPLHELAIHCSLESARHLLQKGVDVQPRDGKGNTPLHLAAQIKDVEFVRLLLEAGADRLIKNHKGQLPVHLAKDQLPVHLARRAAKLEGEQKLEERQRKVIDLLEARAEHQYQQF